MKKRGWIVIGIILLIIVISVAIYFTLFFSYNCESVECFKAHQEECVRTKFVSEDERTTWLYEVKEKEEESCVIDATILQIKQGSPDRRMLEGKSMRCIMELGDRENPETDLTLCSGELKEDIQEILIKEVQSQILSNLEDELKGVL
jgi:hypothetical protein